ncbi:pre-mRNA-splicing factor SLU7-like [Lineus longissimus]|uniref:pre-mRNA-splicing factor SLU7-like n=1 Tax=Lineus longissimus TaxID=88925 RepID=UPI002B4E3252
MSFVLNMPPSVVAKKLKEEEDGGGGIDEGPPGKKREDWKKLKELEEARKAGTAPAMKDEEGKDINPHIPQYIMQAPWYFGAMAPTLNHQRVQDEKVKKFAEMGAWYKRGIKEGSIATKFRKGACENCGAMTHKKSDCLERPRKIGARFTGDKIAPDEYIQPQLDFDFDGKRDRWNGYDPREHQETIEEYAKLEEAKKVLKSQRMDQNVEDGVQDEPEAVKSSQGEDGEDEDKYADDVDMPGQKFESKHRITVRNLRIREDTAKYLFNLDVNSAYYDPKTRSMRQNPLAGTAKESSEADAQFGGDNFVRASGQAHEFAKQQLFAWDAYEKGAEVHIQADPTKLELLSKEFKKKTDEFESSHKNTILDKYGGEEHLDAPPRELLLAQTENYVEYSRHGKVIKGLEKEVAKSKYEEDVFINNHTSVWGSYWKDGQWGFKCCHSCIKGSYCTGEAGKDANQDKSMVLMGAPSSSQQVEEPEQKTLLEEHQENRDKKKKDKKKKKKKKRRKHKKHHSSSSESESEPEEDEEAIKEKKVQMAIRKEEERQREVNRLMKLDERKRPYNSMYEAKEPTEEEMEAYYRKRRVGEDPMAAFLQQ